MGHYTSIRGWLDYPEELFGEIESLIESFVERCAELDVSKERAELYQEGWSFPKGQVNWTAYLFYGGDVRSYHENFIMEQLKSIASMRGSDGDHPKGRFDVADDELRESVWSFADGVFREEVSGV